ncbi:hypothetical protein C2G38_2069437 [Gigaspora rosea]|uniref:Uncharacterized protein n=1 Tax=Gigaspora rosea TaxID=44941 RepID=A0A397VSC6_9GLOM|nr:hypothetical protein C2G38_2069437 [Gigaspora rosea]
MDIFFPSKKKIKICSYLFVHMFKYALYLIYSFYTKYLNFTNVYVSICGFVFLH